MEKPFRGWNEGINTSASLSYLLGTYFRQLPSNERKRLDVIPVDSVCRGMTLIAAAIVERRNEQMYQLATSVTNPCDMRTVHRTDFAGASQTLPGAGRSGIAGCGCGLTRFRFRSSAMSACRRRRRRRSSNPFSASCRRLPLRKTPLARAERSLERVEKLIELFEPFILLNEHDFVADNVEKLAYALVPEEKADFGYDTRGIDWWEYWINIHIPALRRWTYPLIEGRPLEARPTRSFQLAAESNGEAVKTGTNGATWRYS